MRIEDLEVGAVVRLKSGSPKMTVTGFGPVRGPQSQQPPTEVHLVTWSDRLGLVKAPLSPALLVWPASAAPTANERPAEEPQT